MAFDSATNICLNKKDCSILSYIAEEKTNGRENGRVASNDLTKGTKSFGTHENGRCIKSRKSHAQNRIKRIAKALDGTKLF